MFILDLYRFCESRKTFDRQDFAKFIYGHREAERLSRSAGFDRRMFATALSREFFGRCCSAGYLDLKNGVASAKGADFRPLNFELKTLNGPDDSYISFMLNIGEMSDEEIFGK